MTKKRVGKQRAKRPARPAQAQLSPRPFTLGMTASAEAVYRELRRMALEAEAKGEQDNQHCTTFRMVDHAIREMIPANPTSKDYALHGPLANFFRIKKGRMRIVWAVSTTHRAILIVYVSTTPRKEGDAQDPYRVLTRLAKAGHLKTVIEDWQRALAVPPGSAVH